MKPKYQAKIFNCDPKPIVRVIDSTQPNWLELRHTLCWAVDMETAEQIAEALNEHEAKAKRRNKKTK